MTKKMRELQSQIKEKTEAAKAFLGENEIEKANKALDEADELKNAFLVEERLEKAEKEKVFESELKNPTVPDSVKKFAAAARSGFLISQEDRIKALNEGTDVDGGYTVPEDILTKIEELRDAKFSLLDLVSVVPVKTMSGARTFKTRAQQTGFAPVAEGGKIRGKATPKFSRITYKIEKYAGYFPVTNELLADSDANIASILMSWIADESRVTKNKLILEEIAKKDKEEVFGYDGIKKIVNVDLGQAFKSTSKIITNDDGLQYLDTLKDNDGRYLLTPNPSDNLQMRLAVGGTFIPVVVIPNADLESKATYALTSDTEIDSNKTYFTNDGDNYTAVESPTGSNLGNYYEITGAKIPVIIGDLKEGICLFDRQQLSIKVSDTAMVGGDGNTYLNAFEEDLTLYRAIEREDVETRDAAAFVNGYINIA